LKKCKKDLEASKNEWSAKEQDEAKLKLELEELRKSMEEAEEQIRACEEAIDGKMEGGLKDFLNDCVS